MVKIYLYVFFSLASILFIVSCFHGNVPLFFYTFLDVGNLEDISNAYVAIKEHLEDEGLNVLINNAGILERENKIEDLNPERMIEHFKVNAIAPAMIIKVSS